MNARVKKLIMRRACKMIAGDVTDAIATRLNGVHVHLRQLSQDLGFCSSEIQLN